MSNSDFSNSDFSNSDFSNSDFSDSDSGSDKPITGPIITDEDYLRVSDAETSSDEGEVGRGGGEGRGEGRGEGEGERDEEGEWEEDDSESAVGRSDLKDERGAFDRTSGKHPLLNNCGKYNAKNMQELGIKVKDSILTIDERVACMISFLILNNEHMFTIDDMNTILDYIKDQKIPDIQNKNALGLLLGYYISNPFTRKRRY